MLVITRKRGQSFTVGEATITILDGPGQVRIGIDAPKHIEVKRDDMKKDKKS